jgi:beta-barrel assembly-enhancing protease
MKKIIFQLLIVAVIFFGVWFALSKIDWMKLFKVEQLTQSTETKLGDLFWDLYNKAEQEIKAENVTLTMDSLLSKICKTNNINKTLLKLHVIKSDEINAFAMPNNHLVVYSGLILASENEGELCGIMAHEIAHIQLKHVMKKLISEVGLSVLISITTGGGGEQIKEIAKLLSSTAYDRTLEKEADIKAVDYLKKANLNPENFANFLYRLGESESTSSKYFSWISTHPESKERAEYIIKYGGTKISVPIVSKQSWEALKNYFKE